MTVQSAFQPKQGANQKVTASTSSQSIVIGKGNKSLRVVNAGAQVIYFKTYLSTDGSPAATAADTPVLPAGSAASVLIIEKPEAHDSVAYIADSATPIAHFQPGEGGC